MFRVLAAFAAAVIALLVAFAAQSVHDTQSMATVKSALVVTQVNEDAPVIALLRSQAMRREANFYQLRVDPTGQVPSRTLAPIIGDRITHARAFPRGRYAAFDMSMTTKLVRVSGDPTGAFLTTLPPRELEDVTKQLSEAGVDAHVERLNWGGITVYMLAHTPIVLTSAVALGAAWLAGFVRSVRRTRQQAVLRVLGMCGPFFKDMLASLMITGGAFAIAGSAAAVVIRSYNGGHQLASYFALSGFVLGLLAVAFVSGAYLPGALPRSLQFRPAFSGWRPWGRGSSTMAVVQVATLALVVFLIAQAAAAVGSLVAVRTSGADWKQCSSCTVTIFNGFGGQTALNDAAAPYGAAVRAMDQESKVVMSWTPGADEGDRFTPGDPTSNVIVANRAFVERSRGRLTDPLRGFGGPGEWGLLVPGDSADRTKAIAAEWRDAFREPLGHVPNRAPPKEPHIATYAPGAIFNYGQTDFRDEVYSQSPLIVIAPASAGLLDDESYFAAGSSGNLLFTGDALQTRDALDAAGLNRSVYSLDRFEAQIARGVSLAEATLWIALIGGIAGVSVLFSLLSIRALTKVSKHYDQLLVRQVHGGAPVRTYLSMGLRSMGPLAGAGVLILIAPRSGLVGSNLAPGLLVIVACSVAGVVIATDVIIFARLSALKELIRNAR